MRELSIHLVLNVHYITPLKFFFMNSCSNFIISRAYWYSVLHRLLNCFCHFFTTDMLKHYSTNYWNCTDILIWRLVFRSNRPKVLFKKGVLKTFAKFTGKHLCKSLFFNSCRPQTQCVGRKKFERTLTKLYFLL